MAAIAKYNDEQGTLIDHILNRLPSDIFRRITIAHKEKYLSIFCHANLFELLDLLEHMERIDGGFLGRPLEILRLETELGALKQEPGESTKRFLSRFCEIFFKLHRLDDHRSGKILAGLTTSAEDAEDQATTKEKIEARLREEAIRTYLLKRDCLCLINALDQRQNSLFFHQLRAEMKSEELPEKYQDPRELIDIVRICMPKTSEQLSDVGAEAANMGGVSSNTNSPGTTQAMQSNMAVVAAHQRITAQGSKKGAQGKEKKQKGKGKDNAGKRNQNFQNSNAGSGLVMCEYCLKAGRRGTQCLHPTNKCRLKNAQLHRRANGLMNDVQSRGQEQAHERRKRQRERW